MKAPVLFTLLVGITASSQAQVVEDTVEMLQGYTNESYYSLSNDEQANIDNTTWDLAFDLGEFGFAIRTNEHVGTEVYVYPNGTDWATVDTTGMTWNTDHNSETTWGIGALNQSASPNNQFDLGWGVYNPTTHHILGDSIHIIRLSSGEYRKLMVESLISGVYKFKHAKLDGTNEVNATIAKGDFPGKNFIYYSMVNDAVIDREPAKDSWDIVFTKYSAKIQQGVNYTVTGVLSNKGTYVREANGVDPASAVYTDYEIDSVINVIGWDWKTFAGMSYTIEPDLSYFIEDQTGDIWHIVFTLFEGSSTGKIAFTKERVAFAKVDEQAEINSLGVYPNPATDNVNIVFNATTKSVVSIIDLTGKKLYEEQIQENGFIAHAIPLHDFTPGAYFVQVATENEFINQKLIVE